MASVRVGLYCDNNVVHYIMGHVSCILVVILSIYLSHKFGHVSYILCHKSDITHDDIFVMEPSKI